MSTDGWSTFQVYPDEFPARIVAGLLENEGVPAWVISSGPIFGCGVSTAVVVPTSLLRSARWVLAQALPTDAELEFLATGRLGADEEGG